MVYKKTEAWIIIFIIPIVFLFSACNSLVVAPDYKQNITYAEIYFEVSIPAGIKPSDGLYLEVLDEVTGLGLNPVRYQLQPNNDFNYSLRFPLMIGSVLKYRYVRGGNPPMIEYTSRGTQVRYRLLKISGPTQIKDSVVAWQDLPFQGESGTLQGYVVDSANNAPVPEIMVCIAGMHTFTASDGSYTLAGVPVGQHNLVAYHMDGTYQTFQQGAVIANQATTPAIFGMASNKMVNVSFQVTPPSDHIPGVPIRIIGNLLSFGNTFSDLQGGVNVIASRAPVLNYEKNGKYTTNILLPVGSYIEYKYSLGDGFWNAERASDGNIRIRQIVIPNKDIVIRDSIESWKNANQSPITFNVSVPADTPSSDIVSLQLNPFVWMEPLPMWSLGNNQWTYTLYNPLDFLQNAYYRFCRNDQCNSADDAATIGKNAIGMKIDLNNNIINYSLQKWAFINSTDLIQLNDLVNSRDNTFKAGIELQDGYFPDWQPYTSWSFIDIGITNANWIFFTPSWSFEENSVQNASYQPGNDPNWKDITQLISYAKQINANVAIFPSPNFDTSSNNYWSSAPKSTLWWNEWFERYHTFILHFADLSAQNDVQVLIIGGKDFAPALPNGKLSDGSLSKTPYNFLEKWKALITDIRSRYSGQLIFALPYPYDIAPIRELLASVDQIYIQISSPLTSSNNPTIDELSSRFNQILDTEVYPIFSLTQKPIIIGIKYPSVDGGTSNCINSNGQCISINNLDQPDLENPNLPVDLKEQADVYLAALRVINQKSWIVGFISRGFYPPVTLIDQSSSIRGKPASQVLAYWFSRLIKSP